MSARRILNKWFWVLGVGFVCALVGIPLYQIFIEVLQSPTEGWRLLTEKDPDGLIALLPEDMQAELLPEHTVLYERVKSTCIILCSVIFFSSLLGIALAWMLSIFKLKGKAAITFLLALPLAIPSYVMASCYKQITAGLELSTSIYVREQHGAEVMQQYDEWWNYGLAILVLTCSYYPYVFLAARSAFSSLSPEYMDSARLLGDSSWRVLRRVALPLARPAIVAGVMLVALETLNEYGAMKIIGIETLLTEVFKIRAGTNDLNTAVRVASCIMLMVFVLLVGEQLLRGRKKFHASRSGGVSQSRQRLGGISLTLVYLLSGVTFMMAFALPMSELLRLASHGIKVVEFSSLLDPVWDSFCLAFSTSAMTLVAALFIAYANRLFPQWWMVTMSKMSTLGYAVPGAILGIGIIAWNGVVMNGSSAGDLVQWLFYQSTVGLMIAYGIRFLTVSLGSVDAGFKSIRVSLDEASSMLNCSRWKTFLQVHLPLLRPSIMAGLLILFVDVMKELPMTLILSPFNTETLAINAYSLFAVQEDYARGSLPALILVLAGISGMVMVRLLLRTSKTHS